MKSLDSAIDAPLVFSALPKEAAETREVELAAAGHVVCTNASTNRMLEDVPLRPENIPEQVAAQKVSVHSAPTTATIVTRVRRVEIRTGSGAAGFACENGAAACCKPRAADSTNALPTPPSRSWCA